MKNALLLLSVICFSFFVSCTNKKYENEKLTNEVLEEIKLGNLSDAFSILHSSEVLYVAGFDSTFVDVKQEYESSEKTPIKVKQDIYKYFPIYKFYVPESEYKLHQILAEGNDYFVEEKQSAFMNINGQDVKFLVTKGKLPTAELLSKDEEVELKSIEGKYKLKASFSKNTSILKIELLSEKGSHLKIMMLKYIIGTD